MSTFAVDDDDDHSRTILHFDIDCFYAQVETLLDASLADKPVGIQQKNIVVTCNYLV
jgi:DNA polymerase iota